MRRGGNRPLDEGKQTSAIRLPGMPRSPPPPPSFFNSCARLETIPGGESSPVVVGRSLPSLLLLGGEAPGRVDGQKKRGVASVSDAAGGTHFKRCHHHKVLLLHLNLPPVQVTTLISPLLSFRRARARDRLLERALPGVAVGGEAGGREWEGRGRGQLAVARPLVGGRVHHGVRRQNEVSSVRNMERETISV